MCARVGAAELSPAAVELRAFPQARPSQGIQIPIPARLCTFPIPAWWSWSKRKLPVVLGAVWMLLITPRHPHCCFRCHLPKPLKGKENLCSFFLSFLSPCPCVLLLLCSELPHRVHAAQRKLSGRGAVAPSGNCSYQTASCQKGIIIIIIKPLMVSREIRRYSCS